MPTSEEKFESVLMCSAGGHYQRASTVAQELALIAQGYAPWPPPGNPSRHGQMDTSAFEEES